MKNELFLFYTSIRCTLLDISTASHSFVQTSTIVIYRYHLLVPQILIALHWQYCWVRGRGYVQVSFYPIGCRRQPCPWHVGEGLLWMRTIFTFLFLRSSSIVSPLTLNSDSYWSNTGMFKNFEETAAREQDSLQKFSNQNRGNCLTGAKKTI